MTSTTALARSAESIRLALIGKLLLRGFIEAAASEDRRCHDDTWELLGRLGATQHQLNAACDAIADCASGGHSQPGWWRRTPRPMGPLMTAAVKAYKAWQAKQPREPDPPNTVRIGDTLIHIVYGNRDEPEPVVIDLSDTDETAADAEIHGAGQWSSYHVDLGPHEPEPDEPEPAPADVEPEPMELEPVEPPMVVQRVVHAGIW